jgi:TonB family protein
LPSGARTTQIPIIKLDVKISAEEDVEDIRVVAAPGVVDEATKAVKKWKFKPARDKEGKPFPVRVTVEVKFNFVPGPGR